MIDFDNWMIEHVVGKLAEETESITYEVDWSELSDISAIAKFDPEDNISAEQVREVLKGEFDAIQLGGTYDIEDGNMKQALEAVKNANAGYGYPVLLEPGGLDHVGGEDNLDTSLISEPDYFTVPSVRNTGESKWVNQKHIRFNKAKNRKLEGKREDIIRDEISSRLDLRSIIEEGLPFNVTSIVDRLTRKDIEHLEEASVNRYMYELSKDDMESITSKMISSKIVPERYFVVNPDSNVANKSSSDEWVEGKSTEDLMKDAVAMVENSLQEGYDGVFYIEGSGAFAPPEIIRAVSLTVENYGADNPVWYGGGIVEPEENDITLVEGLQYGIDDFDSDQFDDRYSLDYGPEGLDGEMQRELVEEAGADARIIGNSIQGE